MLCTVQNHASHIRPTSILPFSAWSWCLVGTTATESSRNFNSCYDSPQFFLSLSYTVIPSVPAPPYPTPIQPAVAPAARPVTPAARPLSPMQVDPTNVPLLPTAEVTPAYLLQSLPSPPTIAICQPPLAISTQPSRRQYHAFYQLEPISSERAVLR